MSGFQWTELRLKNRSLYLFGQLFVLLFFLVKSFLHLHVDGLKLVTLEWDTCNDVTLKQGLLLRFLLLLINISKPLNEGVK